MEEKKITITVSLDWKDMYDFLLYHSYHSMSGIFGTVFGLFWIVFGLVRRNAIMPSAFWMYLGIGLLFVLYMPVTLFSKAKMQMRTNPALKEPLTYVLSEQGIEIMRGEEKAELGWDMIRKICVSSRSILIYTGIRNSSILPKAAVKEQMEAVKKLVDTQVSADRRKGI